ncbi:importin subunit alpha-9-like [Penaeus japonicus]|uniref:importin subunit alpha-9-like n=1 Tax=Penaeus japonicus TaxID=27405 RepID=UPI001C70B4A9|nr:importin subunit alpha-9-like [Penaeus japonicus]
MESMDITNKESILGIRQRARDVDQAARTKRRSLARDARRVDLDDIVKKLQVPSREEVLSLAEQLKKQKDLDTLQRLRLGLVSDESISAFLDWNGALYAVVGCLTGQDASLQREAACTLVNLALGSEKQCLDICQRAGVYLVMHMSNNNPQLQDPCAWCIGNLCGTHRSVCQLLQTQQAEDALMNLLDSYVPHVIQSAAYALLQYLTTVPERIEVIVTPSMVTRLIEGLSRVDEGIADVGWCLFILSTRKNVCCVLIDKGIIQAAFTRLEKLTNQQSLNVSAATSLVRVVLNCVGAVPGASVEVCHRSEQLVSVAKALLYSPHPHLRTETLHMLSNVINAVSADTSTGQPIANDLNLKPRLENAVRSALAARFTPDPPNTSSFH